MTIWIQSRITRWPFRVCLVLFAASFAQCSSADDEWKSCIYNGKESFFRPDDEACCQGNILPRAENLEEACCNGQLFDSTTGKCCGDHTWINHDTQLCCGHEVHAISEHGECCNHQWIETTTHTCCAGRVVEGVGECCGYSDVYNDMTEHCCLGPGSAGHVAAVGREAVVSGFLECCGLETIDTRNKLCCLDNPTDRKSSFTECCGADTYDTRTQVCCESGIEYRISPLVDGKVECCGLVTYNEDTDQCCESVITPNIGVGKCCGAEAYNPLRSSCCDSVSLSIPEIPGVQACCSGVSYLKTQQVCCGNALHDLEPGKECCGNSLYDVTNQLCCKGNIMEKAAPTSQCCGGSNTFDPEQQTCCGWQVSDFPYGSCCRIRRNAFQAYQPGESKCCSRSPPNKYFHKRFALGRVQSIDAECCGIHALADGQLCDPCSKRPVANDSFTDACCSEGNKNPKAYNKETHICYENEVYAKKQFQLGRAPCGDKVYTTDTEICCDGTIHPKMYQAKKPHQQKCCGTEAYVPDWHTCVGNSQKKNKNFQSYRHLQVNKKVPEHFAEYCQDNVFNNQTDVCDRSNWHIRPIEEMELGLKACDSFKAERGYYPYDPAEQECCGGVLIGPGETCCLETLRFSTPGTGIGEGSCCGSEGFNPHTHVCCDEVLHPITVQGQECCGRELFDPSSPAPMCCNDTLLSTTDMADGKTVCTDGVAHRPTDTVCQGSVYPVENGECCGPVLMDSSTEICCQEKFLYPRATHGNTCCGRVAYDTLDESKKCCMDSLFHDAQNSVCCHSRIMDPSTETCRAVGDVHYSFPKNFFRPEGEIVPGHTVCNGLEYPFSGECCGNEIVGSSEVGAICCGGRKQFHGHGQQAMCCSGEVFDSERYTCCGEKPLEKHHHWMTCCNGEPMGRRQCRPRRPPGDNQACNPSKMSCCNGQIYNAPMKCCNSQIYDPELYNCSSDNVLQPFCGGAAYDNSTLICCSGATYDASSTGCCNGEPYVLGKRTCCAEKLYRVKNGSCCGLLGDKAYNQDRYLCCDNSLRRKKKGRSQCCGSSAYNPETDTCCNQSLTRGTRRGSCCGDRAFDPTQKLCCPKTEALSRRRDDSEDISEQCCAPGFQYNKDAGACQQQVLSSLERNIRSSFQRVSTMQEPQVDQGLAESHQQAHPDPRDSFQSDQHSLPPRPTPDRGQPPESQQAPVQSGQPRAGGDRPGALPTLPG
ncbi:uncharacterized protein LOC119741726 isoform X2 [Patiria miniata]|uniref:Galaxin-like repeats domain-containing protein n=1 Tax=Patiria miniata TaxID=46514 RepID=A0A914BBW2_PATMI|nr:uncharacterized protein LOC119741726 isoform X2 [Patiria miniata]